MWNEMPGVPRRKIFPPGTFLIFFREGPDILWALIMTKES
jgi:hypothetical protein